MIDRNSPVTEDELHAYVDGELPADRTRGRGSLACRASRTGRAGRRLARAGGSDPRALRRGRRGAGAGAAQARPGDRSERADGRRWAAMAAAAAVVAFVVGGAAGWMARGASACSAQAASSFHQPTRSKPTGSTSVEVRHPVEVPGSERAHMTQWLSKRLG